MKKLYIITAFTLASMTFVSAETEIKDQQVEVRPNMMLKVFTQENDKQVTTGDVASDSQIKALTKEMEDKIQAIRSEYMAKIKAIISQKKTGTTTPLGMMRGLKAGFDEGNKLGRPFASSTSSSSTEREKEDNSKSQSQSAQNLGARIQELLKGFFGR